MDQFLPPGIRNGDVDTLRRARLLLTALFMVVLVAVPTAALLYLMDLETNARLVLLGIIPSVAVVPVLWLGGSVNLAAHLLTGLILLEVTLTITADNAFALPALLALPILTTAIGGRWHGVPWGIAVAASCVFIGIRFGQNSEVVFGLSWVTAIIGITISVAMWIVEGSRESASRAAAQANSALQREHERTLQLERFRSVAGLATSVAHDYNNLLMVISGYSEGLPDSHSKQGIDGAVRSASQLTQQLIALGRIAEQANQPPPVDQDLRRLLLSQENNLRSIAGDDHRIDVAPENHTNPCAIDPVQFEQILLNLVNNALDATATDAPIRIILRELDLDAKTAEPLALSAGAYQELLVVDQGVGMDQATLDSAFNPFFTTKPLSRGSGLGLASCVAIAQSLGGSLSLSSSPQCGTTARVLLPRAKPSDAEAQDQREVLKGNAATREVRTTIERDATRAGTAPVAAVGMPPPAHGIPNPFAGRSDRGRILLVEDEDRIRTLIALQLEEQGYQVALAESAEAGLAWLEEHHADALVSDIRLPGATGLELSARVQELYPALPTLLISGSGQVEVSAALRDNVRFLAKPFKSTQLSDALHNLLAETHAA